MLIFDVNVLIGAFRAEAKEHDAYRRWLETKLHETEPVGISELVLSGFVRVVTNHRAFPIPATTDEALAFCAAVRHAPSAVPVRPGPRHWEIFEDLCRTVRARGNLVPDAYHAALAMEVGATWVSSDRDFAKFPGLRWTLPLE